MNSFGVEKAVVIRQPSTANLMIDSDDRNQTINPSWADFQISRTNSIANGFFTRIGATEVVLEWCEANIPTGAITLDISGATVRSQQTLTILNSFMTVAQLLNEIAFNFNGTNGVSFSVSVQGANAGIDASGGKFRVISTPLALKLEIDVGVSLQSRKAIGQCPDLRQYRYLDFISPQITYAQDLKDTSTQLINRDVLCRWYMAEDSQESYDQYGYPILMGYEAFVRRRLFNPPKQIKWDNTLPLGNIQFQVYDDNGDLMPVSSDSNFLMTLQLSEN